MARLESRGDVSSDFSGAMRQALAAKEQAETDLAEAVAASALEGDDASSSLESAREAHHKAEERVARLIEEASLYAARTRELTGALEHAHTEVAETRRRAEAAEAEIASSREATVVARRRENEAVAAAEKARLRCREAVETEEAAVSASLEAERRAAASDDRAAAASAAASATSATVVVARERCDREAEFARASVAKAHETISEVRRAADLELGEARRDTEVHRQRRLAARTELLSIAKALETARGDARSTEQAAREQLVPRLLRHSQVLSRLVERAVKIGRDLGAKEDALLSTNSAEPSTGAMPAKYLGELADEIQRIDSGFELLRQTFDVIEDTLRQKKNARCCWFFCASADRRAGSTALPGAKSGRKRGYHRVQDLAVDDNDDDDDDGGGGTAL